ncbi:uncharacterized protein BCR38DRAFT_489496 [Pseudomassariella vexata]|uniref:Uncharacterized protein n=1 Tax=Pseudomassariella vexata TaxID=1141098 RepID=A0A1Y2DH59_9PEZI|nr:uncharacterized protein BCR38DRAFT_489496 [Pseudomassariella vexata]ORY58582.1 hypothetical protein BCR38DRAFT_489496 [Pseudomassariella vexata]
MGSYVSVPDCQSHYNITLDCNVVFTDNTNTSFLSLGGVTKGNFESDPDIGGVGILGVFIAVTSFALAISVLDVLWQIRKIRIWNKGRRASTQTVKRPTNISWSDVMETLVQACSDQQIFTAAAYALTLRYWRGCTISAYHYNIVANLLLLTCATHLMSVTIIRDYWKHPLLAFVRVICVSGVFVVTGVLMSNQNAQSKLTFPTALPPTNETSSLMFLPAACFQNSSSHLMDIFADSTSSPNHFFVDAIGQETPKNKIQGWRWYLIILFFYGAAIIAEAIRYLRRGGKRGGWRKRLADRFRPHLGSGTLLRKICKYFFLWYLIAGVGISCVTVVFTGKYIFDLRKWVDHSGWILSDNNQNPENDATSFGQLVPIFLSALIGFSFLQILSEKVTDHGTRKHAEDDDDNKAPQIGTIQFLDPSSYDFGKMETAYYGAAGHQIATPGTMDLESAAPWPNNKHTQVNIASCSDPSVATNHSAPGTGAQINSPLLGHDTVVSPVTAHPNGTTGIGIAHSTPGANGSPKPGLASSTPTPNASPTPDASPRIPRMVSNDSAPFVRQHESAQFRPQSLQHTSSSFPGIPQRSAPASRLSAG